jgi:hypothetical protein
MDMAVKVVDKLIIVVHGILDPSDYEWHEYLNLVASHGVNSTSHLIYTAGGTPTVAQYRELFRILDDRVVPMAIVTDAFMVRASLAAVCWITSSIRAYPVTGLVDALDFLRVLPSRYALVIGELQKLRSAAEEDFDR